MVRAASLPAWLMRTFVILALWLLVGSVLTPLFGWTVALAVAVVAGLAAAVLLRRHAAGTELRGSVWDAIPSRQYAGRHAESGGLARDDQERALERTREAAEEMERQT